MIVCCDDFFNRIKTEETDNTEGNTIWLLRGEILPGSSSAHICTVMICVMGLMCAFLICYAASNTLRIAKEELTPPCSLILLDLREFLGLGHCVHAKIGHLNFAPKSPKF